MKIDDATAMSHQDRGSLECFRVEHQDRNLPCAILAREVISQSTNELTPVGAERQRVESARIVVQVWPDETFVHPGATDELTRLGVSRS